MDFEYFNRYNKKGSGLKDKWVWEIEYEMRSKKIEKNENEAGNC